MPNSTIFQDKKTIFVDKNSHFLFLNVKKPILLIFYAKIKNPIVKKKKILYNIRWYIKY